MTAGATVQRRYERDLRSPHTKRSIADWNAHGDLQDMTTITVQTHSWIYGRERR